MKIAKSKNRKSDVLCAEFESQISIFLKKTEILTDLEPKKATLFYGITYSLIFSPRKK